MTSKNVMTTAGVVLLTVLALVATLSAQTQTLTVLHNFTGPDGIYPQGHCCSIRRATSTAQRARVAPLATAQCSSWTRAATKACSPASGARPGREHTR